MRIAHHYKAKNRDTKRAIASQCACCCAHAAGRLGVILNRESYVVMWPSQVERIPRKLLGVRIHSGSVVRYSTSLSLRATCSGRVVGAAAPGGISFSRLMFADLRLVGNARAGEWPRRLT